MSDSPGAAVAARESWPPPRDNLVRAMSGGVELRPAKPSRREARAAGDAAPSANANGMPTFYGYFARFDEWTLIDSWYEGRFMERIAKGAFRKTLKENDQRVLFQHGRDPQVGDKPMGVPEIKREDDEGAYHETPLFDTTYNRDLVPGLEAGVYGQSFRFSVLREDLNKEPGASDHNPEGLPERTIREARVPEFGAVTFPAYAGTDAGVRSVSLTDAYLVEHMTSDRDGLQAIIAYLEQRDSRPVRDAAPGEGAAETDPDAEQLRDDEPVDEDRPEERSQEPPAQAAAPADETKDTTSPDTAAPERHSTPLYTGKNTLAAPGSPTPLSTGSTTKKRRWEL